MAKQALNTAGAGDEEPSSIDEKQDALFENFDPEHFDRRDINKMLREPANELSGQ